MKVTTDGILNRRCYNLEDTRRAVEQARARAQAARKQSERSVKQPDDATAILAISQARGCPELGRAWIANRLGSLAEFKAMLAARHHRHQRLFGSSPVR